MTLKLVWCTNEIIGLSEMDTVSRERKILNILNLSGANEEEKEGLNKAGKD